MLAIKNKALHVRKEYLNFLNAHFNKNDIALIKLTLGVNLINRNFDNYEDFIEYNSVKEKLKLFEQIKLIKEDVFDLHDFFIKNLIALKKFEICEDFSQINFLGEKLLQEKINEKFEEYLENINFYSNLNLINGNEFLTRLITTFSF